MNAVAPHPFGITEDERRFGTPQARGASGDRDRPTGPIPEATASPWRAPLFYLSFVAAALLLIAVGFILMWRIMLRSRRG
ncbi:hypothetical protein [Sphingomonas albertensis]|uniref:Uncharacterized protein n=1 Tax=Sphingomonas albertensis TaxID=2762591 RepID=A0ABR7AP44_9SPHN|nr:hypothetical protein [Sphingomonas albertensis]MBC3942218.1 hypothetical protein [Sphingomonas albertensis]